MDHSWLAMRNFILLLLVEKLQNFKNSFLSLLLLVNALSRFWIRNYSIAFWQFTAVWTTIIHHAQERGKCSKAIQFYAFQHNENRLLQLVRIFAPIMLGQSSDSEWALQCCHLLWSQRIGGRIQKPLLFLGMPKRSSQKQRRYQNDQNLVIASDAAERKWRNPRIVKNSNRQMTPLLLILLAIILDSFVIGGTLADPLPEVDFPSKTSSERSRSSMGNELAAGKDDMRQRLFG